METWEQPEFRTRLHRWTHRCAIDKGLASIVLADGPAGLRLMKYYNVNEGKIISMPFEFSLEGGLFYNGPAELLATDTTSTVWQFQWEPCWHRPGIQPD